MISKADWPIPPTRAWVELMGCLCALAVLTSGCGSETSDPITAQQSRDSSSEPVEPLRGDTPAEGYVESYVGGYVGSEECQSCHADAFAKWSGSHHDLAMQDAANILGDFDDAMFTQGKATFRFFRRDDKYWVESQDSTGTFSEWEIAYTFGVDPLQQYLVRFPNGRFQSLSVAWDTRPSDQGGQRWFHLYPDDPPRPGDPFHWTGAYQTWNHMCAECHSTNLQKGFDSDTDSYETTWSEIDVACEACHGPGSLHVADARAGNAVPARLPAGLATGDSRHQVDSCAPCHSRRHRINGEDSAGGELLDDFVPATLRAGLYHSDGQILDEVYVYGSFLQSRMYAKGVACSDCHDPHSLELRKNGNALCTQCHSASGNPRFPSLTKKPYDAPDHHFHPNGSTGAQCVNCHMPTKTYMQVDPRRDHSFRIPRPDLSVSLGTPDACTACHADRTAAWASESLVERFGPRAETAAPEFAAVFDSARRGETRAIAGLTSIVSDSDRPAILRATALELLSVYGPATAGPAIDAMKDGDPWVRATAARSLALVEPEKQIAVGAPLLTDPVRAVRIEAARVLASAEIESPKLRRARDSALAEYVASQKAETDTPSGNLNLAILASAVGDHDEAIEWYLAAIELDPDFFPARANLAVLYGSLGRHTEAERLLREGIARDPDRGEFHYSLGLVLAESGRFESAAGHIGRAAELLPQRARVQYNHGLALQQIGELDGAERALLEATRLAPRDPEIVYALASFYVQAGNWERARVPAAQLVELTRGAPEALNLMRQIDRALANTATEK